MFGEPTQRPIRLPSPNFDQIKLPISAVSARDWYRVHPSRFKAIHYDLVLTHRFSHPASPTKLMYLGINPETCFWECFGDLIFDGQHVLPKTKWDSYSISKVTAPPIKVCDLGDIRVRNQLCVDMSALLNDDISICQTWGLALQQHPDNIAAFKFKSRFTTQSCLVLFERSNVHLKEKSLGSLNECEAALKWLAKFNVALV